MLKAWFSVKELLLAFLFTPLLSAQTTSSDLGPMATVSPSATFTQVSTSEEFMPLSATQILLESISDTMTAASLFSINPTPTTTSIGSSQASTPFSSALLESTPFPMTMASSLLQTSDSLTTDIDSVFTTEDSATTADLVSSTSTVQSVAPTMSSLPPPTQETESSTENRIPSAAIAGIAVGALVTVTALCLSIALIICFCCSWIGNKKYEYSTGNEYRMTVQQWNVTSAQYNMNRADSVSSIASSKSRGSSLFGSLGFGRRYSSSTDHVTSVGNISVPDLYSTPL